MPESGDQVRFVEKKSAVVSLLSFLMASSGGQASRGELGGIREDQGDFEGFEPMANFPYAVGTRARIENVRSRRVPKQK